MPFLELKSVNMVFWNDLCTYSVIFGLFRPFLVVLVDFRRFLASSKIFWSFLCLLGLFYAFLGHFGRFWRICLDLWLDMPFYAFWSILWVLAPFMHFWSILEHFSRFAGFIKNFLVLFPQFGPILCLLDLDFYAF